MLDRWIDRDRSSSGFIIDLRVPSTSHGNACYATTFIRDKVRSWKYTNFIIILDTVTRKSGKTFKTASHTSAHLASTAHAILEQTNRIRGELVRVFLNRRQRPACSLSKRMTRVRENAAAVASSRPFSARWLGVCVCPAIQRKHCLSFLFCLFFFFYFSFMVHFRVRFRTASLKSSYRRSIFLQRIYQNDYENDDRYCQANYDEHQFLRTKYNIAVTR